MAQTVTTTLVPYCDPTTALSFIDWRTIADLINDTDGARPTQAQVIASPTWLAQLMSASGMIESACLRGQRYSVLDLQELQASGGAGQNYLQRLCAMLATGLAIMRRPDKGYAVSAEFESIVSEGGTLDQLANGTAIFPFVETINAGILNSQIETINDIRRRNGMVVQATRYWGRRADRSPGYGCGGRWGT